MKEKKYFYMTAIVLLDILLLISLFHAAKVEKECQNTCDQQIENIKTIYDINEYPVLNMSIGGENGTTNKYINTKESGS